MLRKRKNVADSYPRQFRLLIGGLLIARMTVSMMWPFFTIFFREKIDIPLTTVTLLLTIQAIAGIISTFFVGTAMDRYGRKRFMVIGLMASAVVLVTISFAETVLALAILLAFHGAVERVFPVGVSTMVADLVPVGQRAQAYALIRMAANLGISIGPILGGILAVFSFEFIYRVIGFVLAVIAGLVAMFVTETLSQDQLERSAERAGGYVAILHDRLFLSFFGLGLLTEMGYTNIFVLLPVYVIENFGLSYSQVSLFLSINALLVVLFQFVITRITVQYRTFHVLAFGAFIYGVGLLSVTWGSHLLMFIASVIVVTMGELVFKPTAIAFTASHAPAHMRARYMGIYDLSYPVSAGIGPVIGGILHDSIAPVAIWYGAGVMAFVAMFGFLLLSYRIGKRKLALD